MSEFKLVAVDGTNGFTYIGKIQSIGFFSVSLKDYLFERTEELLKSKGCPLRISINLNEKYKRAQPYDKSSSVTIRRPVAIHDLGYVVE